ncbi:hypothetical protein [Pelagibius sp. Alg239-R121]|uniref:VirB4 family type IV secretion/conjugal transfer ATPase n=1 Tax=Pelagibius sp. Alg239-R121 TaxID=2993448 RepID=UPI0024A63F9F|nr:hypothetical protein [Pelagibius sp. Alg239-R121]
MRTHIPAVRFLSGGLLSTKNSDLIAVFRIRGVSHETASAGTLRQAREAMSRVANMFDDGRTVLYAHTIRRKVNAAETMTPVVGNDFAADLDELYRRQLTENETYEIRHYFSIVFRPVPTSLNPAASIARFLSSVFRTEDAELASIRALRQDDIEELRSRCGTVSEALVSLGVERLTETAVDRRETLQLMTMLANGVWTSAPDASAALDEVIPCARLRFKGECLSITGAAPEDNRYGAILAVSAYGDTTDESMFDALVGERAEFILTESFMPLDRVKSGQSVFNAAAHMKDAGDEAESLIQELATAKDAVASRRLSMGQHHLTITVLAETEDRLSKSLSRVVSAVSPSGLRLKREDLGMEAAWWAQLPGNMSYQTRSKSRIISHDNFADMAAFHTHPVGALRNLRWGMPVTLLETSSLTPYHFSFHAPGKRAPGNTAIYGPTGSGKTTVANFLICETRRLPQPPDIIYFDKDRVAEAAVRALGGEYFRLTPDENIGFNPFALAHDGDSAMWLTGFVERLIGGILTPEQQRRIADAVKRTVAAEPDLKNFDDFVSLLRSVDDSDAEYRIKDYLKPWHSDGDRAWLFANHEDSFLLDQPVIGFDMTGILDSPKIRSAVLDYLFYRIERKLSRGYPTIIILDEAWRLLDDPRFASRIKDWIKTIRSKNGIVVFMTQEPADAAKSAISETLVQSTETNIFFGNPDADHESYVDVLGLPPEQLSLIRGMAPEMRRMLIKNSRESLFVSTRFRGMDPFLKVLAGTAEGVREMDRLRRIHGEDWLAAFMAEEIKQETAA